MPVPPLRYFAWLRTLPPPQERRHDLLGSGMGPEDPAVLAARAGPLGPEAFADLAFGDCGRIEEPLARWLRLPREQVRVQTAATGATYVACRALLRPGNRVAVEEPGYEPTWVVPESLGAQISFFRRRLEDGRLEDPRSLPPADLYVATHPHNPTGFPLHGDDLAALRSTARRHGGRVLLAGAYLLFLEDDGLPRPLPPELLLTGSLTKTLGLSSLRLGFAAFGAPPLAEPIQQVQDLVEVYPPPATWEIALRIAFDGTLLCRARDHAAALQPLWRRLAAALPPGFSFPVPPCGVHALLQLPPATDDLAFCAAAARRHEVWATPGSFFRAPGTVRIGCGQPLPEVEAALEALLSACQAWPPPARGSAAS